MTRPTARAAQAMLLLCVVASACEAQTVPDAGSLMQRLDRERTPPAAPRATPSAAPAAPPLESTGAASVTVTAFRIVGNRLLSAVQLAPATASFLNRPLTFAQLQEAAAAVATAYRKAGWIANVYLPRQDIENGVVTLQVIEAVFGKARIEGPAPQRIAADRALAMVLAAQVAGEPVNGDAIDRALLLLDDLPGLAAAGSLQAGQQEQETDLVLSLADKAVATGDTALDNTGSRATGTARFAANAYLNSPLRQGDLWGASLLQTRGVGYARLSQVTPVGYGGWRVGASASTLNYRVVAAEFAALDVKGSSSTFGLEAHYPVLRSRLRNLYLALNADRKHFDNQAGGVTSTRYRISSASVGLAANAVDNLGGGGTSNASFSLTHGNLDLDGSPHQAADAASTRAAGHFMRVRYGVGRQQVFGDTLTGSVQLSAQRASKNLDSAEKFYLGGASGVRAYPTSEAGGSAGHMVNLELAARMPYNLTLAGFYDWGQVTVNADNSFPGATALNRQVLRGGGLSLAWVAPWGSSFKATWARRTGANPNPTASGNDQDGSLRRNRLWLVASHAF